VPANEPPQSKPQEEVAAVDVEPVNDGEGTQMAPEPSETYGSGLGETRTDDGNGDFSDKPMTIKDDG
jgi:hypothetical protein